MVSIPSNSLPEKISELAVQSARRWPDKIALRENEETTTFSELQTSIDNLHEEMTAAGVGGESMVGVMGANSRAFVAAAFAASACGAVVMPMAARLSRNEMDEIFSTCALDFILQIDDMVLSDHASGSALFERSLFGRRLRLWPMRRHSQSHNPRELVSDAAFIRFTSGTTGKAKGVILSHRAIIERTQCANRGLGLDENDTVLWVLPMAYHFFVSIVLYVRYGCEIVISHASVAEDLLDAIIANRATLLYAAPMHYRMLAEESSERRFSALKTAISTSSSLPRETARQFQERYGLPITQAYGIIEVGLPFINTGHRDDRPMSIGAPLPDYEAALFDEEGRLNEKDAEGELGIRGPGMFSAYLNPPSPREKVLRENFFMTGDYARQNADGAWSIVGRKKSVIIVGGQKVYPEEVESVINHFPGVATSRAYGVGHPRMGEVVEAELVPTDPASPPDAEALINHCVKRLSNMQAPQRVHIVDQIAQTPSGKIARH